MREKVDWSVHSLRVSGIVKDLCDDACVGLSGGEINANTWRVGMKVIKTFKKDLRSSDNGKLPEHTVSILLSVIRL